MLEFRLFGFRVLVCCLFVFDGSRVLACRAGFRGFKVYDLGSRLCSQRVDCLTVLICFLRLASCFMGRRVSGKGF